MSDQNVENKDTQFKHEEQKIDLRDDHRENLKRPTSLFKPNIKVNYNPNKDGDISF